MSLIARFHELVGDPLGEPPLGLGAALIAAAFRPGLDPAAPLATLDELAGRCPATDFAGLLGFLGRDERFRGGCSYDDPKDSMIDSVLERRAGLPILLAVVAIEVGARVGIAVDGIGMPGHFLVGAADRCGQYGDLFSSPAVLSARECRALFHTLDARRSAWTDGYLRPVGSRAMLLRMLNNLKRVHHQRDDRDALITTLHLRSGFPELERVERDEFRRAVAIYN